MCGLPFQNQTSPLTRPTACNVNNVATAETLSVASGDSFTFEWHHNDRSSTDDIIASSHLGPVMVYIAPTDTGASGDGWVKIYEDGYDATTDTWAVTTLIANAGKHSITIPDIKAGNYLLRAEIIALHEASTVGAAQFYMECVQIKVTSSGTTELPSGVSIPGTYTATDAGINFNIYSSFDSYPIPGPAVWSGAASSGSSASTAASSVAATSAAATSAAATSVVATSAVSTQAAVVSTSAAAVSSAVSSAVFSAVVSSAVQTSAVQTSAQTSAIQISSVVAATSTVVQTTAAPTTLSTLVKSATSSAAATTSAASSSGSVALYGRCGGTGYTGTTTCVSGATCQVQNPYYSQCVSSS